MEQGKTLSRFKGLNNVTDPLSMGLEWLAQAENVDITDRGKIRKRAGYTKTMAGSLTGAYATLDFSRLYLVDSGYLKAMTSQDTSVALRAVISTDPMHFAEVNDRVFFNNGVDRGVISPDHSVIDWDWPVPDAPGLAAVTGSLPKGLYRVCTTFVMPDGRETGNSDPSEIVLADGQALQITGISQVAGLTTNTYVAPAGSTVFQLSSVNSPSAIVWNAPPESLGVDLMNDGLSPLPTDATVIQIWKGRVYAAQYFEEDNQTAIWFSQPLGFHLFNLSSDFILIPGRVTMLAPSDQALLIGSDDRIYAYTQEALTTLAPYGAVPGWNWSEDGGRILFWTARGLCAALPFTNLTEKTVSVAPGVSAGGCVVHSKGQKRYLVALQRGGHAFNPYS